MKLLIAGSRDLEIEEQEISRFLLLLDIKSLEIISGTAIGVDKSGELYANKNNIKVTLFPADWTKYGKYAGPIRNKLMAEYCDFGLLFINNNSKGTKNMVINLFNSKKPFILRNFFDKKFTIEERFNVQKIT